MATLKDFITANREKLFWVSAAVFLFAFYFSHLGYIPLDITTDEPRRALVSLEMIISHDYITPTLNGEIYLNKPPLYNWVIVSFVKLFGSFSMYVFRLPVILSLGCMGVVVFFFTKKFTGSLIAFFTAFAFCSNGRILIYDSFQGLIDTTFSLIVYLNFIVIYWYGEKNKFTHLFIISYLLTTIGFLTKGVPMLVFEAISLLTYFSIFKKFKTLFSYRHFAGIFIFLLTCSPYYITYFRKNNITPEMLFANLLNESTKRTPIEFGPGRTFFHLLSFPFEFMYHFAPWTIFLIALFQKNLINKLKENRFIFYSACLFSSNIIIYWISPEVYARYLFMLLPLLFSVLFYLYFTYLSKSWQSKTIETISLVACIILPFVSLALPYSGYIALIENGGLKAIIIALLLLGALKIALSYKMGKLYALIMLIVVIRLAFNFFVIEQRGAHLYGAEATANKISTLTKGHQLYLLRNANLGNFDGMSVHISRQRNEVLKFADTVKPGIFYICDMKQVKNNGYNSLLKFENYSWDSLHLVQLKYQIDSSVQKQ